MFKLRRALIWICLKPGWFFAEYHKFQKINARFPQNFYWTGYILWTKNQSFFVFFLVNSSEAEFFYKQSNRALFAGWPRRSFDYKSEKIRRESKNWFVSPPDLTLTKFYLTLRTSIHLMKPNYFFPESLKFWKNRFI